MDISARMESLLALLEDDEEDPHERRQREEEEEKEAAKAGAAVSWKKKGYVAHGRRKQWDPVYRAGYQKLTGKKLDDD